VIHRPPTRCAPTVTQVPPTTSSHRTSLRSTTRSGSRDIARRAGARLVVVHVETPPVMALVTPDQPWPIQETMAQRTDDLRTQAEADG
jgi:hypothetical protein